MLQRGASALAVGALLLLVCVVLPAQAFVVPSSGRPSSSSSSTSSRRCPKGRAGVKMMLLPPEAPQSFLSSSAGLMVAVSRFVKDVPSTLTDMADGAADAVGATATGTNPDGSYTNAGEAVEEIYNAVNPDLPPPYYAVAFALVLLVVSGIQQLSLGNVFDEEEKSASSSGAVARRLALRNRSFFKGGKKK